MTTNPFLQLVPQQQNPFMSMVGQKPQPKPREKAKGGFLGEVLTGNTQRFGKTTGQALASKKNTDLYIQALEQHSEIRDQVLKKIKENKRAGKDTTILESALRNMEKDTPKLENFTGDVINKSTSKIAGEALGTAVELTGVGALKGAKGIGLAKNLSKTAGEANKARQAYNALSVGGKALKIGKDTAKAVASVAPFGYAYDVSAGLQGDRGEDRTGKNAFKPGMGTAISTALPVGIGALRFGRVLAGKVLPHVVSNLSGEPLEAYTRRQTGQLEPLIKGASKERTLNVARDAVTNFRVGMIEDFGNSIDDIARKYPGVRIGFDDINAKKLKDVAEAFGFDMPQNVKSMSGKETSEVLTYLSESYIPNASTLQDVRMNNVVKALRDNLKSKAITAFGGKEGEFAKTYSTYASKSDLYKEIAGVVGKVGQRTTPQINAARNRLYNIFNENSSAYLDAVKKFEQQTGSKILDEAAAAHLTQYLPKTLRGAPTGIIGWASDLIALVTAPFSSPRGGSWLIKQISGMDEPVLTKLLDKVPGARKAIYDAVTKENMSFNNAVKKYIKNPQMGMSIKDVSGQSSRSPVNAWSKPITKAMPTTKTNIQPKTANISKAIPKSSPKVKIDGATKQEMIDVIDYIRLKKPYNQVMEENAGKLAEKFGLTNKTLGSLANKFEKLLK